MAQRTDPSRLPKVSNCSPRKLPRQARSRALVDAILDAAAALLVDRDGDLVTTNAIAEDAGVSIGSLYQYFANRESIIAAVADRHADRVYRRVADVNFVETATLDIAVSQVVEATFVAHRIDTPLHSALSAHWGHIHFSPLHRGSKSAIRERLNALPTNARRDVVHPDLPYASLVASEIIHGLAHSAILRPNEHEEEGALEYEAAKATCAYLKLTTDMFFGNVSEHRQILALYNDDNNSASLGNDL